MATTRKERKLGAQRADVGEGADVILGGDG
jgi:hypothetical protein